MKILGECIIHGHEGMDCALRGAGKALDGHLPEKPISAPNV